MLCCKISGTFNMGFFCVKQTIKGTMALCLVSFTSSNSLTIKLRCRWFRDHGYLLSLLTVFFTIKPKETSDSCDCKLGIAIGKGQLGEISVPVASDSVEGRGVFGIYSALLCITWNVYANAWYLYMNEPLKNNGTFVL